MDVPGIAWLALLTGLALIGVVWRYRALERAGSGLPTGAGGTRLRGVRAEVVAVADGAHVTVRALGDEWRVTQDLDPPLDVGEVVRIVDVEGTRLVVERTSGSGTGDAPSSSHVDDGAR